jgi:hypothetical protein
MAPRAYWKGYLRLSLVSCPISLFPATSEREKASFHQINSKTGNRIRYRKVDEGTGDEVPAEQIISGYEVGKKEYIAIADEELEAIALESTRTTPNMAFTPPSSGPTSGARVGEREVPGYYGELVLIDECGFGEATEAESLKQTDPIAAQVRFGRSAQCRRRMSVPPKAYLASLRQHAWSNGW